QAGIVTTRDVQAGIERGRTLIADAVTGAQYSFVFSAPWQGPAETDGRREIVPVVLIKKCVGIRRVLANQLQHRRCAGSDTVQPCRAAHWQRVHTVRFPGHAVPVITYTKIQRQIRTDLPIIFKKSAPLVLVVVLDSRLRDEVLVTRSENIEREWGIRYRTGEVQEKILHHGDALARQPWN